MEPLVDAREDTLDRASEPNAVLLAAEAIAWPELVQTVHRYMRSIVGPGRDIEDLTQMALEQLVRGLPHFEGRAQVSTFTYRVCAHVAMNHWRWWRRWLRRFQVGTDAIGEPRAPDEDLPARALERQRAKRLHDALGRLSPMKRLCITLADFEELPAPRIAEILECPEPTVRSRLRQARLELSALIKNDPFFADALDQRGRTP